MGLKKFQVVFDNPWNTYYAGTPVTGKLILVIDSPKKIRALAIHFKGEAHVEFTESRSETDNEGKSNTVYDTYTGNETYFENKYNLVGGPSGEITLEPGEHTYPFTTHLPPNLPSSFEGEHGFIRYTVKGIVDRPWKFDQDVKMAFTVISPLDLNQDPSIKEPVRKEDEKTFCCLCCASGPLTLASGIPMAGYVPGQTIACSIDVDNGSNVDITQVKYRLSKKVVFKATSPSLQTRESKVDIVETKLGPVNAHFNKNWTEQLNIPAIPPSNLVGCSLVELSYTLKVEAVPSGVHRTLQVRIPITIGTVPIIGSVPPGQIPAPSGSDMPISQPSAPTPDSLTKTDEPAPGWNLPSQNPSAPSLYPTLVPSSFDESHFGSKDIKDANDSQYTQGTLTFAPRYPVYNFAPQN